MRERLIDCHRREVGPGILGSTACAVALRACVSGVAVAAALLAEPHVACAAVAPPDAQAPQAASSGESFDAWVKRRLGDADLDAQCWFVDAEGRWVSEQTKESVAVVVVRKEAATSDRAARLVFGPVLMSAAARRPSTAAASAPAAAAEESIRVLGWSFAGASLADTPTATGGRGAVRVVVEPSSAVLGVPAPLAAAELGRVLEYASEQPFDALDGRCAPRGTKPATDGDLARWRRSAVDEVASLAARGARLLGEARARASAPPVEEAPMPDGDPKAAAGKDELPLFPPQHPLGFVAWAMAVDGQQALKRASGDIKGADRDVANLRRVLQMAGATRTAALIAERVPVQSEGFQSWSYSPQSPLDAWDLAASVSKGIDARRRLVERLRELALKHAVLGGFPQEGLDEIEMRFAMLESNLPIGWTMGAADEATMSEHLEARLNGSLRQGIDRVQARTVAWEVYAAAWNLSDALPREVVEARAEQQARFTEVLMDQFSVWNDAEALDAARVYIQRALGSPFQASFLCPGSDWADREVLTYLAKWKSMVPAHVTEGLQMMRLGRTEPPYSEAWHGIIDSYAGSALADMIGPLSSDIAPTRHRVVPLIPFPDASSYYSSSTGRPKYPRLIVR